MGDVPVHVAVAVKVHEDVNDNVKVNVNEARRLLSRED
jgi:hypothetical protein